ncbi:MAG: sulfite exporter TauE/SafE family protein, partial [Chloroflexi bacterium]|nr:sulfite exporter TauE/SafE family protein [Chloroflexota bacterium]
NVANLRLGMTLELFTAIGALVGGLTAFLLDERFLEFLFAALLAYVAVTMLRHGPLVGESVSQDEGHPSEVRGGAGVLVRAGRGDLRSVALDHLSTDEYRVRNLGRGVVGSTGAGVVSALLGVGGGIVKVPLMHLGMGVPMRVATATSNLMIGITAAASAVIYLLRDQIDPYVAGPTAIGVFLGASMGSRVAHRIPLRHLRILFVVVLLYTATQMLLRAIG